MQKNKKKKKTIIITEFKLFNNYNVLSNLVVLQLCRGFLKGFLNTFEICGSKSIESLRIFSFQQF
jgi:hypothetical protein